MNPEPLAPIFLDNKPIALKEPKPRVSAILSADGRQAATDVKWMKSQADAHGTTLRPDDTVDRTSDPSKAIYLTSRPRPSPAKPATMKPGLDEPATRATANEPANWGAPKAAAPADDADTADQPDTDADPDEAKGNG